MLADDRRAWSLDTEDTWWRVEQTVDQPAGLDTFETLMSAARHNCRRLTEGWPTSSS
jgi:hypothetical protein